MALPRFAHAKAAVVALQDQLGASQHVLQEATRSASTLQGRAYKLTHPATCSAYPRLESVKAGAAKLQEQLDDTKRKLHEANDARCADCKRINHLEACNKLMRTAIATLVTPMLRLNVTSCF